MNSITKKVLLQALASVPTPSVILNAAKPGFPVVHVNVALEKLLGREAAELSGQPFIKIMAEGRLPESAGGQGTDLNPREFISARQKWHTRDGVSVPLDIRISRLHDRPGKPGFLMLTVVGDALSPGGPQAQDTAELRNELVNARRQIKNLQRTDPVTGLANRGAFDEVLNRDWSIARREQRRIGVIVFSVDCMDEYRQIYGRHATDSLLRKVGHAIGGTLRRAGDFGARIENDRFAVLVGDSAEDQARTRANNIASKVRKLAIHHPRSTESRFATVSFGVASEVPIWTEQSVALLAEAERQLETRGPTVEARQSDAATRTEDEEINP